MKKILLILTMIGFTLSGFGQERNEKLQKRAERDTPPRTTQTQPPQTVIVQPTPYYNPYAFGGNRYAYRNPYSRRRMRTNPPIVVGPQPQRIRRDDGVFGFQTTLGVYEGSHPTLGFRILSGNDKFIGIFGYEASARNPYSHYNNISIVDVEGWEDEFIGDFKTTNTIELGMALHMDGNLYTTLIGYGTTNKEYLGYFDEEFVLSPNGEYSINGYTKTVTGLQMGIAHRTKITIVSLNLGLLGPKRLAMGIGIIL